MEIDERVIADDQPLIVFDETDAPHVSS